MNLHLLKINDMLIKISDTQIYSDAFIRNVTYNPALPSMIVIFNDATTTVVNGNQATLIWNTLNALFNAQLRGS